MPAVAARVRPAIALVLGAVLLVEAVVYRDTFASMIAIWVRSDTFAHCFLILPISLYLIWQRRDDLAGAAVKPSLLGIVAVAVFCVGWIVASSARVQVGQQLCAVGLLQATVLALLGVDVTKRVALPLLYLFFAVPFGLALLPSLMDFTAAFAVAALRLTGIPVLREGLYFSIPRGDFEVAQACSGLRYLIACVALGIPYAYLSYRSTWKRLAFIAASVITPIIANGVRAYLIVMIAHLSDMKLARGVDHLIYGWILFGLLILLMFWIGNRYQDPPERTPGSAVKAAPSARTGALAAAAAAVVALTALTPYAWAAMQERRAGTPDTAGLPLVAGVWTGPSPAPEPRATVHGVTAPLRGIYTRGDRAVELEVVTSRRARDGDIVGHVRRSLDDNRVQILAAGSANAGSRDTELAVNETVFKDAASTRLLWYWYRRGDARTAADWQMKVREAWINLARGDDPPGVLLLVSTADLDIDRGRETLREFVQAALPGIEACATAPGADCASAP